MTILANDFIPPILLRGAKALLRGAKALSNASRNCKLPDHALDEKGPEWYNQSFTLNEHWRRHYTESPYYFLWSVVADRIVRAGVSSVLEIGCGSGQMACLLRDKGIKVYYGIDFSPERINWARHINPGFTFVVEDIFRTDILEAIRYEAVVCTEVLEHVKRDVEIIKRVQPGARFYGSVPNFPYVSHIRHFNNPDEVGERYASYFSDFRVDIFLGKADKEAYFLIEGKRKSAA